MDLAFSGGLVLSVLLAVLITGQVKGVQLLAVYLILGLSYFYPCPHRVRTDVATR